GANFCVEPIALGLRALVTPDQCRTQDLIVLIQQNCAMHLPSKPDSGDIRRVNSGSGNSLPRRRSSGAIPVLGILLCPSNFWRCERGMLAGCRAHYLTALVGKH